MPYRSLYLSIVALLVLSACASQNEARMSPSPRGTAHDFALSDQDGNTVRLSEVLKEHQGAVIAFYPKDDSRY